MMLSSLSALFVIAAAATVTATSASAAVPELGVDNLQEILQSRPWTCVLLFDPSNDHQRNDLLQVMTSLQELFVTQNNNTRVTFATLDIRRHPHYRAVYTYSKDPDPYLHDFYSGFPDDQEDSVQNINSKSFMNLQGDVYWPSRMTLFGHDMNVYGEIDLVFNANVEFTVKFMQHWISQTVHKEPEKMKVLMRSPIQREALRTKRQQSHKAGNAFNFAKYFAKYPPHLNTQSSTSTTTEEEERFLVLESGATKAINMDVDSSNNISFWTYDTMGINSHGDSEHMLSTLADIIDKYLIWCEAYEVSWTEERKRVEDEQTNYGSLLQEMNTNVRALIDGIFDNATYVPPTRKFDHHGMTLGKTSEEREDALRKRHEIPNLKPYFDEMVMGYGRSPASLKQYLEDHVKAELGSTPEERRQNRHKYKAADFTMFQRMQEYMQIVQDATEDGELYLNPLHDLVSRWHNILVDFHTQLNQHYVHYIENHPLPRPIQFRQRQKMDILDMDNPDHYAILTDYDAFHNQYTKPAIPVILANVNMTTEPLTLESLVEQCSAMDVTDNIRWSNPVGQKSSEGWGGLKEFILPDELVTPSRRHRRKRTLDDSSDDYDSSDEDESDDDDDSGVTRWIDRSITLQQFVTLSEKIGNVYLHDQSLPDSCDTLLYNTTLYDLHQKFHIPYVVAGFDFFHRITLYNYARSWPSLFIGRKGTNSKVHVDAGASSFYMWLVKGRKRWIVYHPSERPYLYDRIHNQAFVPDVLGFDKSEHANEVLSRRFPLLHRTHKVYEIIQEPGQLIYIPPSCPHAVENLDDIIGVALNLAPRDGFASHLHDQIHFDRKFGFTELALKYWLFEDNAETPYPTKDPLYATFAEYKAQY